MRVSATELAALLREGLKLSIPLKACRADLGTDRGIGRIYVAHAGGVERERSPHQHDRSHHTIWDPHRECQGVDQDLI